MKKRKVATDEKPAENQEGLSHSKKREDIKSAADSPAHQDAVAVAPVANMPSSALPSSLAMLGEYPSSDEE